ncbi:DUF3102 domain-containing protein [Clostridium butyricum]|uniref:DUF3102 domain-containing protein n=1 Tax=Clostridium butyricum TaxID=1492 RepID=UPI002ABE4D08|nr:DUF3102 domain-containing protein [Clostridium butyricum]
MEENKLSLNRTPELIAAEIVDIKNQTKKMLIYNSIEIGRRLTEAKLVVPHGEWGKWLEEKVDYSKSTANNLMNVFKEYGADQMTLLDNNVKSQAFGSLSYTQAVELLKIPEEDREQFVEENNVEEMSTRELKKAIAELEQLKKEKDELKTTVKKTLDNNLSLQEKMKKLEKESTDVFSKLEESQNEVLKAREETEELKGKVKELEEKPVEVITGIDEARVKELEEQHQKEIQELNSKISEAQSKLNELESKETEVIKEVDEDKIKELQDKHKKEVDDLRKEIEASKNKVQDLEIKLNDKPKEEAKATDESLVKFKVHFDGVVSGFKTLLSDVEEIDVNSQEKYRGAVKGLLNKMLGFV